MVATPDASPRRSIENPEHPVPATLQARSCLPTRKRRSYRRTSWGVRPDPQIKHIYDWSL